MDPKEPIGSAAARPLQGPLRSRAFPTTGSIVAAVIAVLFFSLYVLRGGVWSIGDVVPAARGILWLWFPLGIFLFCTLRSECADITEAVVLSAVGSLGLTTGLSFACDTIAVWWQPAKFAPTLIRVSLFVWGCVLLVRQLRGSGQTSSLRARASLDWTLVALLIGSLCATARYQRAFEAADKPGDSRYVLDGDQTYFTALAYELQRGSPATVCPIRANLSERAYHHLPHLTLALLGAAAGQSDLLHLHLVVHYTVLVLIMGGLNYCLARELGGRSAGILAIWLVFIGAVPTSPLLANPDGFFYFTIWPQSSSSIEPVLLTSPQMFCGLAVALGGLLGLLRVQRLLREQRPCLGLSLLTAALTALTLRFRVQAFVVMAPLVGASLLILAVRYRRWSLAIAIGLLGLLAAAQLGEMRLPTYLPNTNQLRIGNNKLALHLGFVNGWPGAQVAFEVMRFLSPDRNTLAWRWQFTSFSLFCLLNIVGLPLLAMLGVYLRTAWRRPPERVAGAMVIVLFVLTVIGASLLAASYDAYSLGGQLPLHLGWYLLPFGAVGLWRMIESVQKRWPPCGRAAPAVFWGLTIAVVVLQMTREPDLSQARVRSVDLPATADQIAAWNFCRNELPPSAVVMDGHQLLNIALWSGLGGRRTYLEYVPASRVLDPLLPAQDSISRRARLVDQIFRTDNPGECATLIRGTSATHLIEVKATTLKIHPPELLRPIWQSPHQEVKIWEVLR